MALRENALIYLICVCVTQQANQQNYKCSFGVTGSMANVEAGEKGQGGLLSLTVPTTSEISEKVLYGTYSCLGQTGSTEQYPRWCEEEECQPDVTGEPLNISCSTLDSRCSAIHVTDSERAPRTEILAEQYVDL